MGDCADVERGRVREPVSVGWGRRWRGRRWIRWWSLWGRGIGWWVCSVSSAASDWNGWSAEYGDRDSSERGSADSDFGGSARDDAESAAELGDLAADYFDCESAAAAGDASAELVAARWGLASAD